MKSVRRTLFQISDDLLALDDLLNELEGDVSDPAVAEAIDEWFCGLHDEVPEKIDSYAALVKENEARAKTHKEDAARSMALATAEENKSKRLKERLKLFFETQGIGKMETQRYKLAIQNNGGVLPLIMPDGIQPEDVPEEFRKVRVEIDTDAVRAALEANTALEFAQLGARGSHLRIK